MTAMLPGMRRPPLVPHKEQAVVQADGKIAGGVHGARHGLRFQPDLFIAAALDQHFVRAEVLDVRQALFFSLRHQSGQQRVLCLKADSRHSGVHRVSAFLRPPAADGQPVKISIPMQPGHIVGIQTHMRTRKTAAMLIGQDLRCAYRADVGPVPAVGAPAELCASAIGRCL